MQGMSEYEFLATSDTLIGEMVRSFLFDKFFLLYFKITKIMIILILEG